MNFNYCIDSMSLSELTLFTSSVHIYGLIVLNLYFSFQFRSSFIIGYFNLIIFGKFPTFNVCNFYFGFNIVVHKIVSFEYIYVKFGFSHHSNVIAKLGHLYFLK